MNTGERVSMCDMRKSTKERAKEIKLNKWG